MSNKVLILSNKPPKTYLDALSRAKIKYDCRFPMPKNEKYSALLLIGGGDILPAFYGGKTPSHGINIVRDKAEFDALDYFVARELPVLGICRGLQVINVYFGGGLAVCEGHYSPGGDVCHYVNGDFLGFKKVNSSHRQYCNPVAKNGKVLLYAKGGVPEAVAYGKGVLGLQFHPERMDEIAREKIYGRLEETILSHDGTR